MGDPVVWHGRNQVEGSSSAETSGQLHCPVACPVPSSMESHACDQIISDFYRAAAGLLSWVTALKSVEREFGAKTALLDAANAQIGGAWLLDGESIASGPDRSGGHKAPAPGDRETLLRLNTHLFHALRLHERIRALAAKSLAGVGMLDAFAYPVWLLREDRHVYFANAAAQRKGGAADRVAQCGMHLVGTQPQIDRLLTEQVRSLCCGKSQGARATVDLRGANDEPPSWLHLSLVSTVDTSGPFGREDLVRATLIDPRHVSQLDPHRLGSVLGLTPAQASVAVKLAEGLSAEQIAKVHGTAVATVRSQVREVLSRLGARRVTDAVRALRQGEALWAARTLDERTLAHGGPMTIAHSTQLNQPLHQPIVVVGQ